MQRRLVLASAIAVVVTAAFLPGSGLGSSAAAARGAPEIPAGLAAAIHARFGAGAIASGSAAQARQGPELGLSVALSADGTTALVGTSAGYFSNAAYVFHVSDAGSWSSNGTPTAVLTSKHDRIGFAVALSADGTTAFVGAPGAGGGESPRGAIYVFHVSAEDAWASSSTPTAVLTASGLSDYLGESLAPSPDGTTLVVGQPYLGAYVFHVSSEGAWVSTSTPTAALGSPNPDANYAGSAVAISADGTTVLVSDIYNPIAGAANVYVFNVSAEDAWTSSSTPTAILSDAAGSPSDFLGNSVALSGDGTVALVGAPGVHSFRGAVDVFRSSGEAAWTSTSTPTARLTRAGGAKGDLFGLGVAVSTDGTTALVAALGVHHLRGAAYIFRASDEAAWASSSAPSARLTQSGARKKDSLSLGAAPPSAAKSALKASFCRLGKVRRVSSTAKKGRVVFQSRARGQVLPHGAKVGVKVAK